MGFEDSEADAFIEKVPELGLTGGAADRCLPQPRRRPIIELAEDLSAFALSPEEQAAMTIEKTEQGSRVTFTGNVADGDRYPPGRRREIRRHPRRTLRSRPNDIKRFGRATLRRRNAAFRSSCRSCVSSSTARLSLPSKDAFLDARGMELARLPAEISEADFRLTETGVQWEIDLSAAGKITEKAVGKAEQYDLDLVDTGWTDKQLCRWLERKARQPDITQPVLLEFVRRALAYLVEKRALPLTALVRWKFILAKVLAQKINQHREQASSDRYQQTLFGAAGRRRNQLHLRIRLHADRLRAALALCRPSLPVSEALLRLRRRAGEQGRGIRMRQSPRYDRQGQTLGAKS